MWPLMNPKKYLSTVDDLWTFRFDPPIQMRLNVHKYWPLLVYWFKTTVVYENTFKYYHLQFIELRSLQNFTCP